LHAGAAVPEAAPPGAADPRPRAGGPRRGRLRFHGLRAAAEQLPGGPGRRNLPGLPPPPEARRRPVLLRIRPYPANEDAVRPGPGEGTTARRGPVGGGPHQGVPVPRRRGVLDRPPGRGPPPPLPPPPGGALGVPGPERNHRAGVAKPTAGCAGVRSYGTEG